MAAPKRSEPSATELKAAIEIPMSSLMIEMGVDTSINAELIKNACEVLRYDGFNLEEWIKVNTFKIRNAITSKAVVYKGTTLTLNDVLSISVQIGLMRGNSSREKLISQTSSEGRDFMTAILNATGHLGRAPNSKKKYSRTEFTFLRAITAFPYFACAILDQEKVSLQNQDPIFESHSLPWAIQHGISYAITHKISGITKEQKTILYYSCCAIAAATSARVIPDLISDRIKFRTRCSENERFINLQINHPMYASDEACAKILVNCQCQKWNVCKFHSEGRKRVQRHGASWLTKFG